MTEKTFNKDKSLIIIGFFILAFINLISAFGNDITLLDYGNNKSVLDINITDPIDEISQAIINIDFEHHEIHEGDHFYVCNYMALGNNEVIDFTFDTQEENPHLIFYIEGTEAVSIIIKEEAIISSNGTLVDIYNNNRMSTNNPEVILRLDDTFSDEGNIIFSSYSGSNKLTGVLSRSRELVLNNNTNYLFRITNEVTTSNIISYCGEWYE